MAYGSYNAFFMVHLSYYVKEEIESDRKKNLPSDGDAWIQLTHGAVHTKQPLAHIK